MKSKNKLSLLTAAACTMTVVFSLTAGAVPQGIYANPFDINGSAVPNTYPAPEADQSEDSVEESTSENVQTGTVSNLPQNTQTPSTSDLDLSQKMLLPGASRESHYVDPAELTGHYIENFDEIYQLPELPTGCEITAMTMVLNFYGHDVSKETMALEYLPLTDMYEYYGEDGLLYGPDLNHYFVGRPDTEGGYICGTNAVLTATNDYLEDVDSKYAAVDRSGSSPEELYQMINYDIPILIWCTIDMEDRAETDGWYNEDGEFMEWSGNDHGAVLIGYDDENVTVADPICGRIVRPRKQFERIYEERGRHCVILQEREVVAEELQKWYEEDRTDTSTALYAADYPIDYTYSEYYEEEYDEGYAPEYIPQEEYQEPVYQDPGFQEAPPAEGYVEEIPAPAPQPEYYPDMYVEDGYTDQPVESIQY